MENTRKRKKGEKKLEGRGDKVEKERKRNKKKRIKKKGNWWGVEDKTRSNSETEGRGQKEMREKQEETIGELR